MAVSAAIDEYAESDPECLGGFHADRDTLENIAKSGDVNELVKVNVICPFYMM